MEKKQLKIISIDGTPFFRNLDGVARYSIGFLAQLSQKYPSAKIIIIAFADDKKKNFVLDRLPKNVELIYLKIPRRLYSFIFSRIVQLPVNGLLPCKPDLHISTNFTNFPYISSTKQAIVIHDLAYKDVPETVEAKNRNFLNKRADSAIMKSEIVYVVSRFTKKRLAHHFPSAKSKIEVILPNLDLKAYRSVSLSHRLDLPASYILFVGTSEPRKNIMSLIEAYLTLPRSTKSKYKLVIAGAKGWGDQHFKDEKDIIFLGYIQDDFMPELYQRARLFVFPSIYEGYGLPVAEAIAANIPVLSSDIESVKEFTEGKNITFTDTLSVSTFSRDLNKILKGNQL